MQKHSRTIQKRAVGTDDRAEQSCWKPWKQWSGRAHDPRDDGSRPLPGNHNQDRYSRAPRSEPSDTGLGCPTRCLEAQKFGIIRKNGREKLCEIGLFGETVISKFGGTQAKLLPRWEEGVDLGISELTCKHLICDER